MSRVDEALRQAAIGAVEPHQARSSLPAAAIGAIAPGALEHYPREASVSSDPLILPEIDVPVVPRRRHTVRTVTDWSGKLVTSPGIADLTVEQYRRLTAALHDLQVQHGLRTVMVTSALPQEGKTLTAANLALTLSESYSRRVLLIDADLRRPSLDKLFAIEDGSGLSDVLRSSAPNVPFVTVTERLRVLPAGHQHVSLMAALTSDRMRELLEEAAAGFDWVLVDTPPVAFLPDGQLLARLIKAVVFVIGAGSTPWPVVARAVEEIGRECIVGTVLNGVDVDAIPATSYYRRYGGVYEDSAEARKRAPSGG